MSNSNELYKRQAIWADYRAGNNSEQAYSNLIKKFGPDSVSKEIITGFYLRFKSGDRSLFDKGAPQHGIPQAIQTLPNGEEKNFAESIFHASNDRKLTSKMATIDGRFAIFFTYDDSKIIFADLFHGEIKEVEVDLRAHYDHIYSINMIGQHHLLIRTLDDLILLKVNYTTWEVSVVSRPNPGITWVENVIVDKLDPCKVLIQGFARFVIGSLIGNEIIFSPRQEFDFGRFYCGKLAGNDLCGLRSMGRNENTWMWTYRKIDLVTLTEETIDVPITFNESFRGRNIMLPYHFRAGHRIYVAFYNSHDRIYAFNTETSTWEDTGIMVYGSVFSLFVDQNEILTVRTTNDYFKKPTFYRFPLKKPDSLKNLAWLTIRRSTVLFNSNLYDRINPRLPYGRGLRCLFISDFE